MTIHQARSAGCVAFDSTKTPHKVLLVHGTRHGEPYWGFPKGTVEPDETILQTALRETKEETGYQVALIRDEPFYVSRYTYENAIGPVEKEVYFFLAVQDEAMPSNKDKEYTRADWFDLELAHEHLTYENDREILSHALNAIMA